MISIGLDMAKDKFNANAMIKNGTAATCKGTHTFECSIKGYDELYNWLIPRMKKSPLAVFVMEATGVYHEELAFYLHNKGLKVCIVLPNQAKLFRKSLNFKTKDDAVDAEALARMGLERDLRAWQPMSPKLMDLRSLCRERLSFSKACTRAKNQLHSKEYSYAPNKDVLDLKHSQIQHYEEAIETLDALIKGVIGSCPELKENIGRLQGIPGIGPVSAAAAAAETNGFELFTSISQLVSYAGLDVSRSQSGQHEGRGRISKKGNSRLRQALFMPSTSARQHNPTLKILYSRVNAGNQKAWKKGAVAVMRKLPALCYTLWKTGKDYDPAYTWTGKNKLPGGGEASALLLGSSDKKREASAPLGR